MAPASPLSPHLHALSARGLSSGSIAGATVGAIIGAAIIVVCTLPFIVKALRKRRNRRDAFDPYEAYGAAEMGVGSMPVSPAAPLPSRQFPSGDQFGPVLGPPSHPGLPHQERGANGTLFPHQHNGVSHPAHGAGPIPPASLPQAVPLPVSPVSPASPAPFSALPPAPLGGQPGRPPIQQAGPSIPWEATPEGQEALRSSPFGPATMTSEPEAMGGEVSRSPTALKRSDSSGLGDAVRRFARRTSEALRRGSTRSSGGTRSPADIDMTIGPAYAATPTTAVYGNWDDIPMGGASAEYYSGAPLSPPEEEGYAAAGAAAPYYPAGQPADKVFPSGAQYQQTRSPEQLETPFALPQGNVAPLTPGSMGPKSEVSSDEEVATRASPIPLTDLPPPQAAAKPASSPLHPAPGTVNPMDIMKPSNSAEKDWMVTAELEAIRTSPPAQVPQFAAVVRQPTQVDLGRDGQGGTQPSQNMADYSTPPPDFYSGASNETTPDTRLAEPEPRFGDSLSPSSTQNPSTPSTLRDDQSPGASPRSYRCKECGREFDQVHKLNHHKRYHDRPHDCPHCDKRFGTKTHLDRHVNDKHMKTKKYHCTVPACPYSRQGGKSFPRKDNWRRHMMNKHSVTPDYDPPEASDEAMGGT